MSADELMRLIDVRGRFAQAIRTRAESVAAAGGNVQAAALNGAQVQQLVGIVSQVSTKMISAAAARDLIRLSFPLLPDASIEAMVQEAQAFTPAEPIE